jgi:Uma2 family endonuclease
MEKRYELLDGDMIMVPAPTTSHQRVSRNLGFLLLQFVREHRLGEIFLAPVDVVFGQGDQREVVQPDILWVSRERQGIVTEQEIQGAPDLVIEILSPGTEERDRGYKKALYARYGVKECWIVDPVVQTIEVHVPDALGIALHALFRIGEIFSSPLLLGFEFDTSEVFAQE